MKWLVLLGILGCLFVATQPIGAQEPAKFEKIRDISPDQKFAVRILCSSEPEDPNNIDFSLITGVELVSLPSKKIVMNLPQNYDGGVNHLIWSQDSNWFALSASSGPRVTDTYVYRRSGDDFGELETENLQVDVKGDVRDEYVRPIRWVKPGALLLEEYVIFRDGDGKDATYQFTASFDEKTGNFESFQRRNFHRRSKPHRCFSLVRRVFRVF